MKPGACLSTILLLTPSLIHAQSPVTDPVSNHLRELLDTQAKNLIAAAEEFPGRQVYLSPDA